MPRALCVAALVTGGQLVACQSGTAPTRVGREGVPADSKPTPPPATAAVDAATTEGVRAWPSPAPAGSRLPDLHSDPEGRLVLSWAEPAGAGDGSDPPARTGGRVRFARWAPGAEAWSAATLAADDPAMLLNWADVPRVFTFGGDDVLVTWPRTTSEHAYTLMLAVADDGLNFGDPVALPGEVSGPEFGFASFAREGDAARVFWLDGRATGGHGGGAEGGAMQLRSALVHGDGSITDRRVLDRRVCDCCQTSAAATAKGSVVTFRDRGPTEIRDMALAGWSDAPVPVHDDGWTMPGCPVNGPALAVDPNDPGAIAVAWFTGVHPPGAVNVAFADDGGAFSGPVRIDAGHPLGRVDTLRFGSHAVVTWLEALEHSTEAAVLLRAGDRERAQAELHRVATVAASRDAGFPRLGVVGDDLVVAFTTDRVELAALRPG